MNTTPPPAERFVFERNPFYHRVDTEGQQLPYLDRVIVNIADSKLIPAKTGAGESDLQARSLRFDNYTFLKEGEERSDFNVRLWRIAKGAQMALFPNMNATSDPSGAALNRDVRFRRALSLAINRDEINAVIYFGLAPEGNNTALPQPLFARSTATAMGAEFDPDQANALLDEIGLTERSSDGIRLLPDGEPLEIVVETAGERTVESRRAGADPRHLEGDRRQAVHQHLAARGVPQPRVFAGETQMSIWFGHGQRPVRPE